MSVPSNVLSTSSIAVSRATVFGPDANGTVIKYTEDDDATPEATSIG